MARAGFRGRQAVCEQSAPQSLSVLHTVPFSGWPGYAAGCLFTWELEVSGQSLHLALQAQLK